MGGVATPPATFRENVALNLQRGLSEICPGQPKDDPLYLVCAGPSLRETVTELDGKRHIWALNSAHDWLIARGVIPECGVAQAPEYQVLDYFREPHPTTNYLFASCTNPKLIDYVLERRAKVTLWHSHCPEEWGVDYGDRETIFGGGTIGLRSFDLAWVLGWREIHVLGLDCSISNDDRIGVDTPMYEDRKKDRQIFLYQGRPFVALPSHARQVEDYGRVVRPLTGMHITHYGDGLMQWVQRCTNQGA